MMIFLTILTAAIIALGAVFFVLTERERSSVGPEKGRFLPYEVMRRENTDVRLEEIVEYAKPVNGV